MKLFVSKSAVLSLALLVCPMIAMETPVAPKSSGVCAKVGEFVGSVKAQLPAMPAMPTKEQAKAAVTKSKDAVVTYAKAHPYVTYTVGAAVAIATVAAIYKMCTAKKADKTKVVKVK